MPSSGPFVLLATGNEHKLLEIGRMLGDTSFSLVGLDQFPSVELPPETGATFEENAIGKAVAAASQAGIVAIGDDSGLEVDALGGRPGVYSARYAGMGASDQQNLDLLLQEMADIPDNSRSARFVCALAIASPSGAVEVVRGTCEGLITRDARGRNGFGYDPVFLITEYGRTFGELSAEIKNRISHRALALQAARPIIMKLMATPGQ